MRPIPSLHHHFPHTSSQLAKQSQASECVLLLDQSLSILNQDEVLEFYPELPAHLPQIKTSLNATGFKGKIGQIRCFSRTLFSANAPQCICIGLGDLSSLTTQSLQHTGKYLGKHAICTQTTDLILHWPKAWLEEADLHSIKHLVVGIQASIYRFDYYKNKSKACSLVNLHHLDPSQVLEENLAPTLCGLRGQIFAKNLMHEPANVLTPGHFASMLETLSEKGLHVQLLDKTACEKENMHALLSVGKASLNSPYLVTIEWKPSSAPKNQGPVALVGKGICFDTGGINLKPSAGLEEMKYDMGGAAAVAGTMLALAEAKCPRHVVGVVALAENSVHGNAMRPSDVISSRSGKSIAVLNTDAEGRLILADAIDYTIDTFKPSCMVDLATLTGAVVIALGHHRAGLFANQDTFAKKLFNAGENTYEQLWRLPLAPEYKKMIDSPIADIQNLGAPARAAGSITAAEFLQAFVKADIPWAHLDIAGTGFKPSDPLHGKGPTGFGVQLLVEAIFNQGI